MACMDGDVDLVKRLVSEGLKIASDNPNAIKSLWSACTNGQCEILKYFITSGVNINIKDSMGNIAVHQCAKSGQLECLKMLVDSGADLDVQCDGLTLMQQASACGHADTVEYLMSLCTRAEKIEALELLGTAYVSKNNDLQAARSCWLRSLEERGRAEPGDNVQPKRTEPHPVFGNAIEFNTEQELTSVASSFDEMWMQALIIRERTLGPQHGYSCEHIVSLAKVYTEQGNLNRSISLFAYVFDAERKARHLYYRTWGAFCRLVDKLSSQVLAGSLAVTYKDAMEVFITIVDMLEDNNTGRYLPWNGALDRYEYYALISISILAQLKPSFSEDESSQLLKVLGRFVQLNVCDVEGRTLLHLACRNKWTPYSPLPVVQLLLEAGADPRAVSLRRETPLHIIAINRHQTQPSVIQLLLDSGAHYDACNAYGKSFSQLLAKK